MDRILCALGSISALLLVSGCSALSPIGELFSLRLNHHRDLAELRRDTRQALADDRVEQLQDENDFELRELELEAERRRLERELCVLRQEAQRDHLRGQIRESVESKVAFDVVQALDIGELEVDEEALKELLEQRDQQREAEPQTQPLRAPTCGCQDQVCGCTRRLLKRHCPDCCRHRCGRCPEDDCGGPETLQLLAGQPGRRPLRPAEIPFKLPVRLSFGFDNPEIEETRVQREPILGDRLPFRDDCDRCEGPACNCVSGQGSAMIPPRPIVESDPITRPAGDREPAPVLEELPPPRPLHEN